MRRGSQQIAKSAQGVGPNDLAIIQSEPGPVILAMPKVTQPAQEFTAVPVNLPGTNYQTAAALTGVQPRLVPAALVQLAQNTPPLPSGVQAPGLYVQVLDGLVVGCCGRGYLGSAPLDDAHARSR